MSVENDQPVLEFEQEIAEIDEKIKHLQSLEKDEDIDISKEIKRLQTKLQRRLTHMHDHLTAWQKTQIARHPSRPHCLDYIKALISDFVLLCGDRCFADDKAMVAGIGTFEGVPVVVMGQEKGHDLDSRMEYNFGMAKPEGYRKAQRLMDMASRFSMPVLSFVDTAGAYPGIDAEERGQAEAIAASIQKSFNVKAPIIATIIGEGGSGGAIALATADVVLMLEHSIYSVISPEGCASILWRSADKVREASEALKLTAQDLIQLGIIDEIVPEPLGGAHRDPAIVFENIRKVIRKRLNSLMKLDLDELLKRRSNKFLEMTRNISPIEKGKKK